ncbi:MAG: glycosyltransferase family 4 protein, partial [Anaerolineales bacterium]|nr:glycosyltransferase family 4 protein [Anaerolineales bacterium]
NVNLPGYVPDPTAYLRRAGVMVVPLRAAGGMRVKILHALAQGIPVVSTTIGCEGIRAKNGKHLLIADSAEDFAHATNRLLLNKGEAEMLARNGRALVEEVYDYRRTLDQLGNLYSALAPNGRERA